MMKNNNRQKSESKRKAKFIGVVVWFVLFNAMCWVVYAMSTPGGYLWPIWVLIGSAFGIYGAWAQGSDASK